MSTSPRLPPELCDYIIDKLRNQPNALKTCSVVSKSWTARSRKHIFSTICFNGDPDVVAWRNAFPDASNSPAHHARTLVVNHRKGFPENRLSSFCNVTRLFLHVHPVDGCLVSLTQLHGFTPSLKSLHMTFPILPFSDVLSLVYSFPLLDDLLLTGIPMASDTKVTPSKPPKFSGSLCLAVFREMRIMANHLLSLPSGIHFRELILPWICDQDMPSMMDLISACSHTLESLHVLNHTKRMRFHSLLRVLPRLTLSVEGNTRHSLDLSSALNLKSVVFRCGMPSLNVDWITIAVESIKSSHVKEMTLYMPGNLTTRGNVDAQLPDAVYTQWLDLDNVFVEYLTARSFKLKVVTSPGTDKDTFEGYVERLLPNLFEKKMLEMAQILRA